jgi:hypothetical protein
VSLHVIFDETLEGRERALLDYFHTQHKLVEKGVPRDIVYREIDNLFVEPGKEQLLPLIDQEDSDAQAQREESPAAQQEACTDGVKPSTTVYDTEANSGNSDSDSDGAAAAAPRLRKRSQDGGREKALVEKGPKAPAHGRGDPARGQFYGIHSLTPEQAEFLTEAFERRFSVRYKQQNPKRFSSASRTRYERYKQAKTIHEAILLGASIADIAWDYIRGFFEIFVSQPPERSESSSVAAAAADEPHHQSTGSSNVSTFSMAGDLQQSFMAHATTGSMSPNAQRILDSFRKRCADLSQNYGIQVVLISDPQNRQEAMSSPEASFWIAAEKIELQALFELGCFELVSEAEARQHGKLIASKWVYKVKFNPDGTVQRYKARLVAKGFTQVHGSDYFDTFSPVFGYTSFRLILALSTAHDWQLDVWDLKNGFIQQNIDVPHLYMRCPQGHPMFMPDGSKAALRCIKSLYGLKQSSRLLNLRLSAYLQSLNFRKLRSDQCVFTKGEGPEQVVVCIWVDDIILATSRHNEKARLQFDTDLRGSFEVSPWTAGEANVFLGLKITRNWDTGILHVSLEQMIEKIAARYNLNDHKGPPSVPMDPHLKLVKAENPLSTSDFDYPAAVGALLYVTVTARPDVAQAVGVLSRFMSCFDQTHVDATKQVIRYLYGTKTYGITFYRDGNSIMVAYADADLAGDISTRRSTSGYVVKLNGGIISWSSKLQPTVALSTAEAETVATVEAVKQIMHLRLLMHELGFTQLNPTVVYEDNQAAIAMAQGTENAKRAKHYQLKVCFLQEMRELGEYVYSKVSTDEQLADTFTKALPRDKFKYLRAQLGVNPSSITAEQPGASLARHGDCYHSTTPSALSATGRRLVLDQADAGSVGVLTSRDNADSSTTGIQGRSGGVVKFKFEHANLNIH